ncbi:MAG: ATP-binding protein [Gemmataceae bacterium]
MALENKSAPADRRAGDGDCRRFETLFEWTPVAIWDVDLGGVARWFDWLRHSGVTDLRSVLSEPHDHSPRDFDDAPPLLSIRSCNREAFRLFGAGSKEAMEMRFAEKFTVASSSRWLEPLVQLWNGQRPSPFQTHFQHSDGRIIPLLVTMQIPGLGEGNNVVDWSHVIVTMTDLSEVKPVRGGRLHRNSALSERARHDALEADLGLALNRNTTLCDMLRIGGEALQSYAHAAFVGIWILRENERMLEIPIQIGHTSHPYDPFRRIPVGTSTIGTIAETHKPIITNAVIGNPEIDDQDWLRQEEIVSFAGFPLIADGHPLGVLAIYSRSTLSDKTVTDLRDSVSALANGFVHKRAEADKRDREGRLPSVVTSTMDCKITIDSEGHILAFNSAAEHSLGYSQYDVLGRVLGELIIPDEHDAELIAAVIRYLNTRQSLIIGRRLTGLFARRKDGSTFPTELTIVSTEHNGSVVFAAFIKDITEQRDAEQRRKAAVAEMVRAKEEAEASNRAKTQFLANMSHEFRTPMAAVVGYAQILLDPRNTVDQRMATVHAIRRNGKHLLALINDVLDLTKIEAGRLEVERVGFRLWRTIGEALSVAGVQAQEKNLRLNAVTEGRIPRTITSDPTRIRQILDNLLSNAVKFTLPEKEVEVRVRLKNRESTHDAIMQIEVRDEGIGMSQEVIAKLFKPFSQADASTTRKFGGTGLGLSICKKLAESLRGSLTVESVVGVGSRFMLTIPVDAHDLEDLVDEDELSKESLMIRPRSVSMERKLTGRILLAEDNPDNRYIICFFLEKAGLSVEVAENGRIAVEMACAMEYDVILMDMQMPELDGYEATSSLRQKGYRRAIVALTAHAMADDEEKCMLAGCDAYMTKPVEFDHLMETISKYLPTRSWVMKTAQLHRTIPNTPEHANQTIISQPTMAVAVASAPAPTPAPAMAMTSPPIVSQDTATKLDLQYRKSLPKKVEEMLSVLRRSELVSLASLAHRLKGSAGMYGLPKISETAGLIEQAVRESQNSALLEELITDLQSAAMAAAASTTSTMPE